jgi:SAM-dependent methyltransferase
VSITVCPDLRGLHTISLHESARVHRDEIIETSVECWAYALFAPLPAGVADDPSSTIVASVDIEVIHGRVGVGCLDLRGEGFVVERFVEPNEQGTVHLALRADADNASSLIVRNAATTGASRFRVLRIVVTREPRRRAPYPVQIAWRDYDSEHIPDVRGGVFDDDAAAAINVARMNFIRRLDVPVEGKRVLDVGAGVGHFSKLYAALGATVVAVEGRAENVDTLRQRLPDVEAHLGDIQEMDLEKLGRFDIVHCFGLLYHLDSPVSALRRLERVCDGVLLLETMVCDAVAPVVVLADETKSVNQALAGLGCRPSPSFVTMALNRVGFQWIYGAARPPEHPDFRFVWRNQGETSRDGRNFRCVFVASRSPIENDQLSPLLEPA